MSLNCLLPCPFVSTNRSSVLKLAGTYGKTYIILLFENNTYFICVTSCVFSYHFVNIIKHNVSVIMMPYFCPSVAAILSKALYIKILTYGLTITAVYLNPNLCMWVERIDLLRSPHR